MATNPSTLPENSSRITAPDSDYPYGSAQDDSTGSTGDGTPFKSALLNDIYGFQQALLRAADITPSGSSDTALASEYLQAVIELAAGRAANYDESGAADAYELDVRTGQQAPAGYFDGMTVEFTAGNANTGGAATVNVASLGAVAIKAPGGVDGLNPGDISAALPNRLIYKSLPSAHFMWVRQSPPRKNIEVFDSDGTFTVPALVTQVEVEVVGGGAGGGGASSGAVGAGGGGGGGYARKLVDVSPGASIAVTVGSGGAGGAVSADGGNGTGSSFGAACSATGGSGGSYFNVPPGGAGGSGTGGDVNIDGGAGHNADTIGGQGGGTAMGASGGLGGYTSNGTAGSSRGAGGGGADGGYSGGAGAGGRVVVRWFS